MGKTAIILFAHLPDFEARVKSFSNLSSKKATKKISSVLTRHFFSLARKTNIETFLIDTYQQKGETFGEKISNAFSATYAKGYKNVICIGNDCLDLDLGGLQKAILEVENGKVVLGPTEDGGTYLIGMPQSEFDPSGFTNIKWQTKQAYKNLILLFDEQKSSIFISEVLIDVDDGKDLLGYFKENALVKIFTNIIKNLQPKNTLLFTQSFLRLIHSQALLFRGPPSLCSSF